MLHSMQRRQHRGILLVRGKLGQPVVDLRTHLGGELAGISFWIQFRHL